MPFPQRDIIQICELLSEQENLKVCVSESLKGACYAFGGTLLGGLLGGPVGLFAGNYIILRFKVVLLIIILLGSVIGGTYGAITSKGKFTSIITVINEMPEYDRNRLSEAVAHAIRNIDATDVITLLTILNGNPVTKELVLNIIRNAITQRGYTIA